MEQISGSDLLVIRSQAAAAEDYTTICRDNIDRLSKAYLALQVENVRLRKAIHDTLEKNLHLADGDNCTLIDLKLALSPNAELRGR